MTKEERQRALVRFDDSYIIDFQTGCWNWQKAKTNGYGVFYAERRQWRAARWAYRVLIGPIPDGCFVCHRCDNPACVNPKHLFIGTPKDNTRDMVRKGRMYFQRPENREAARRHMRKIRDLANGEKNSKAKLTWEEVAEIRRLHEAGIPNRELRARFGVNRDSIWRITSGRAWK